MRVQERHGGNGRRGGRSRRVLLAAVLGFAAVQLGLSLLILGRLPYWRDPAYGRKIARLQKRLAAPGAKPFTIVMLGSSRTALGLRAGDLEGDLSLALGRPVAVFNFGIFSAGPFTSLLHLERLLADGIRPDLLLIEVLPTRLAGRVPLPEAAEIYLPTAVLRRSELDRVQRGSGGTRPHLRRDWWLTWLAPCYHNRSTILSDVFPSLLNYFECRREFRHLDASGWVPNPVKHSSEAAIRVQLLGARQIMAPGWRGECLLGDEADNLREMLDLCQQLRLPAALVVMPEGEALRACYPPRGWEELEDFLAVASRRYRVPLVIARAWMAEDAFSDAEHMTPIGATAFTERFGREFLVPLVRRYRHPSKSPSGEWAGWGRHFCLPGRQECLPHPSSNE